MAAMSDYLENALLDHVFNNVAFTSPTTLYLALFTSNPTDGDAGAEVTGGSYSREVVTFGAAASGTVTNDAQVEFADMPAATVSHAGVYDAATNGNLLVHSALDTSRTVVAGDSFIFPVGNYTVTAD